MLFDGLKEYYYRDEDITFKFHVETGEPHGTIIKGFMALYLSNYKSAADWLWNESVEIEYDGYVTIPLKDIPC